MECEKEIYGEFLGDEVLSVCSYGAGQAVLPHSSMQSMH